MSPTNHYGGVIWTNHSLGRLKDRRFSQSLALKAFVHPDSKKDGKQSGTVEYVKKYQNSIITVIAKKNEKRQWVILSCWIDPPLKGSVDDKKRQHYLKYKKASFWGRVWLEIKRGLGF